MKAIIYNTGPDADGIKSGEQKVVDLETAEALAEKWSGMMKVLPYKEPEIKKELKVEEKPKKVSTVKKIIKKLTK